MNGSFYEQLGSVAGLFEQWGACERTVVACVLAKRLPWPGLRLLQRAVDSALRHHASDERLEREANDEHYLANLIAGPNDDDEDDDKRLHKLLTLLPLLRTDNERSKEVWVAGAAALVQRCVDAPRRLAAPDLCRQLLSYLLVHPALTHQDQRTLTQWLRYLESHISGNRNTETIWPQRIEPCIVPETNIWSGHNPFRRTIGKNVEFRGVIESVDHFSSDLLQESFSKNGRDVDISIETEKLNFDAAVSQPKSQRSNSLTPPSTNFMQMSSSAENLSDELFVQKPRSFSLSSEHSLSQIRPISIMYGTTGSETRLDDLRSHNFAEHPGMSTVAQWLKSLRLHKYVWLFTNISYEQMMSMDEKYLEKLGVTKGARHKILLSIKKLSERPAILEGIEAELMALTNGPVGVPNGHSGVPNGPGGVPSGPGRALERLRGVLLSPMPPASDLPPVIVRVLQLASKCVSSCGGGLTRGLEDGEAPDPLSLHCWLVEKALHHEAFNRPELVVELKRLRHRLPPKQFYHHVGDMPPHRRCPKPRWRVNGHALPRRWSGPPGRVPPPAPPRMARSHSHVEDYSFLDALCLQMTEQAIN